MKLLDILWKMAVLGIVQGLAEFLPISSSGHLTLLQRILDVNIEGLSVTFINIIMHVGTLVAVFVVFWKDIVALFQKPFKTLLFLIVATIPAGLVGIFCDDYIDAAFAGEYGLIFLAVCFAVTAVMLFVTEMYAKRRKKIQEFGWKHTVAMGLTQAVALLPGISRSGSTIIAGTLSGAKTEDVSKFSFLMSIPIILGSLAVSMLDIIQEPTIVTSVGWEGWVGLLVGVVFSAGFGFFAIKFMLKIINKANYKWFSLYLILLSVTCIWLQVLNVV